MHRDDILRRIKVVIDAQLGLPAEDVAPEKTLAELGFDSLDLAEFAMGLEDEFGIQVSEADEAALLTVENAIALVQSKGVPA